MKKENRKHGKSLSVIISSTLVITLLSGCTLQDNLQSLLRDSSEPDTNVESGEEVVVDSDTTASSYTLGDRIYMMTQNTSAIIPDYIPAVEPYQANADLSNVENIDRFYLQDQMKAKLAANNFFVLDGGGSEFFDVYESNRYSQYPSFVTVDSMMHTYHLYFAYLQKNTELNYLYDAVAGMSVDMLANSKQQYEELKGTEWEEAAKKNVVFFTVGASLMDQNPAVESYVSDIVSEELALINAAGGIEISPMSQKFEDYSQYKPRGYYDGNEELEKYFRTMMWYGRVNFTQKEEVMDRCSLLMSLALRDDAAKNWEMVYSVTSFFAGASDDSGPYEYLPLIYDAYGSDITATGLIGKTAEFTKYHEATAQLEAPKINSVVTVDDSGATDKAVENKGYRFMGQRFSIDASIFTQLIYSNVQSNANGECRYLPDAMDVPAAFGSETALAMLKENGNFEYKGYEENMNKVRSEIASAPETTWTSSLYGGWMNTLRPIIKEKTPGYPSFMLSGEWNKKNLESFLGSYTELKHDTVLYSKQVVAEMGGGEEEPKDDRGYVEPEVEVYAYLQALSQNTATGLANFGIISEADTENLNRLSTIAGQLKDISVKELTGDTITEEDYTLIREFGGNLEHFWKETIEDENADSYIDSGEYPAALVTDIATDPNGSVLEQGIGSISEIFVIVPVDGKLRVAKGGVFSYYQFVQPLSNRLTDTEWRQKLGMEINENGEYRIDESIQQPEWTQSYRSEWIYEN